ncbi:peptidoglycan D,D-transpeptidase FtsI family protein [Microbacterium sp.]|uniref:peptidoglycan D,D-transpeptidase FtsI family protein n=1 Tax=Microbacterium sp. TaxID=51671 RepID=UPI003A87D9E9
MTHQLRRLSIVMLVMFLGLFASTSYIQVIGAQSLEANPANRRTLYESYEIQRGAIVAGDEVIASSVPSDDLYSWMREYADGPMWAPVTGYINPVLGSSTGLEQAMTAELSGTGDSQFLARVDRIVTGKDPRGSNVLVSLDPEVQRVAFDALGDYQGAVIALEPSTGRVLAMVTSPSYDPNLLALHDTGAVNATYDDLVADPQNPLYDRAIAGNLNPPGSTFKLVVASAALSTGTYTPESTFENPAAWTLPGTATEIHNFDGGTCGPGDEVDLATALRLSCNIPMAQLAVQLGDDVIRAEAERFGFNTSFEIPLASTASYYPTDLDDAQTALSGFGQSDVIATPLQIAMVSAGIANGGVVMNPNLVDSVIAPDLTVQREFGPTEFGRAVDEAVADEMTTMMVSNVREGAASGARIDGIDVAGKTGTAEHGPGDPYTLWFTGFAPADNPQVAVAVMIENGGGLGQSGTSNGIAAPIAKEVIEAVLSR